MNLHRMSSILLITAAGLFLAVRFGLPGRLIYAVAGEAPRPTPNGLFATKDAPPTSEPTELAAFAAGCFWGVEQEFRKQRGVVATAVGYMGGRTPNPTYEEVCSDATGHTETVKIEYDPRVVTYDELLDLFWSLHDPTTPNRQGPDYGSQYRSVIFFFNAGQKAKALASKERLQSSGELEAPIVTEIVPASKLTKAEAYHQQYVEKGGFAACHRRKKSA